MGASAPRSNRLITEAHLPQHGGKARIVPQRVPDRLDLRPVDARTSFRARLLQPIQGRIHIAQTKVNDSDLETRRRSGSSFQLLQDFAGFVFTTAAGVAVTLDTVAANGATACGRGALGRISIAHERMLRQMEKLSADTWTRDVL